ncbi:MAG: hypothetical protein OEO21_07025 [Candidatus Krumholzibacteria bacterium]|nr:hypothetical protein [Candidatus Krumholzibacteria bacterium]
MSHSLRSIVFAVVAASLSVSLTGCTRQEDATETVQLTPAELEKEFHVLLQSLDEERPGESVANLEGFLRRSKGYALADTVRVEVERYRTAAEGRYHEARDLARNGQFDRAEHILEDLATYLPDTPDGDSAREYLEFEFDFGKVKWLLIHQRFDECTTVARSLLERDLTPVQQDQVETVLDQLGQVDAAITLSERSNAENACRQLAVMLAQAFVEEGAYPSRLSLTDVREQDPHGSSYVLRGLSSIEDYRASRDGYSFVAVSAQGRHRIRVVNGEIRD